MWNRSPPCGLPSFPSRCRSWPSSRTRFRGRSPGSFSKTTTSPTTTFSTRTRSGSWTGSLRRRRRSLQVSRPWCLVPVKKEVEKPKPLLLEWLDMTMVEEVEPEKREREEEPPPPTQTIKVAMVENLDMDMQIVQDTPTRRRSSGAQEGPEAGHAEGTCLGS